MVLMIVLLVIPEEVSHMRINGINDPFGKFDDKHEIDRDTSYTSSKQGKPSYIREESTFSTRYSGQNFIYNKLYVFSLKLFIMQWGPRYLKGNGPVLQ
jgi:hypothetical protein